MIEGDKLYCISDDFKNTPFIKGLEYTILRIRKPDKMINFGIIYFKECPDYMIGEMHIGDFFATEKEYRKLKLQKINKKNYE